MEDRLGKKTAKYETVIGVYITPSYKNNVYFQDVIFKN
jgi:hypothetical protein